MYNLQMFDPLNIGGSSQPNIGGSSSLPPPMYPIHSFNVNDLPMYEPRFSLSMYDIVGEDSFVEDVPTQRRRRQKRTAKNNDEGTRCIPWTPEEEFHCAKGWVRISEDGVAGNTRKIKGFWTMVLGYAEQAMKCTIMSLEEHKVDPETGIIPKRHLKNNEVELPRLEEANQEKFKRYKSSESSSFNTMQSGEGRLISMIWLETRGRGGARSSTNSRDKAKKKASTLSIQPASLAAGSDESSARLFVTEYASETKSFISMKKSDHDTLLAIKKREMKMQQKKLEIKQQMLSIQEQKQRQKHEFFYMSSINA
ncbi:hypothetical protein Tco_0641212 [Tanacetum coccineum]